MKKTFEYDLTKYNPDAPTRTEEFITADGVKTLTTDANDGAVLIQDTVDSDSLNPVTAAAVATAIEQGGGGSYTAGDGIAISEGEISAKVDGTTIQVNADGELEAIGGGGGGGASYTAGAGILIDGNDEIGIARDDSGGITFNSSNEVLLDYSTIAEKSNGTLVESLDGNDVVGIQVANPVPDTAGASSGDVLTIGQSGPEWAAPAGGASYTAGDGISIDSNDKISAVVNTDTLSLVAEEVRSNAYGNMPITEISGISETTRITSFTYRFTPLSTSGYWTLSYDAGTQTGLNVRLQVGSDSNFTKYATSTEVVQIRDSSYNLTPVVLGTNSQGTDTLTMTRWMDTQFRYLFDFTSGDSFDDIFSGSSVYLRFVAWDSTNNVVVGSPLLIQTANGSGYFYLLTDNNTKKIKVNIPVPRVGTAPAGSVLTWDGNNRVWAAVPKELPASLGAAGQVLTVNSGATGIEWAAPSGGGGVYLAAANDMAPPAQATYSDVLAAYNAGNAIYAAYHDNNNNDALYPVAPLVKYDPVNGVFTFTSVAVDNQNSGDVHFHTWWLDTNGWTDYDTTK